MVPGIKKKVSTALFFTNFVHNRCNVTSSLFYRVHTVSLIHATAKYDRICKITVESEMSYTSPY